MLKQRIITAVVALAILALVLFVLPSPAARSVIAAVILVGAWEWGGFTTTGARLQRYIYTGLIGALIALTWAALPNPGLMTAIYVVALAWWLASLVWMLYFPTPVPALVRWAGGILVLVPTWLALDFLYAETPRFLLFLLLIVWVADMGAFFVGKGFGRVKLAPAISPGKTWEGVLGGLCAVLLLAAVGSPWLDVSITVLVPFCVAVAMLSVVGDLTVSMFKRSSGLKDSGTLFPGHGGVLDRIDSVSAAAPLFALGLQWTGLQ